jgi:hypothetical protein
MFDILSHKGNANQNYTEIYFIQVRMAIMKKTNNSKCWEDAGKKEPSYDVSGNVKS